MKRTPPPQFEVAAPNTAPDIDDDDIKDVYWPDFDTLPNETPVAFKLRFTFACAGYRAIKIEEAPTHPILIVHAKRKEARRISDHRLFFKHIQNLLCGAGFQLRRDELSVSQDKCGILVAFQWKDSPIDYAAGLRLAEQDAAAFAEMPL